MTTQQQTERDDALIAEKKRLADDLERLAIGGDNETKLCMRKAAALLRGDEPAKPDRYLQVWEEASAAYWDHLGGMDDNKDANDEAAAAVLRRNFEPPVRVIQAARCLRDGSPKGGSAELCADFILKGDQ